jgi:GT2 family glycosyltransferase
MTPAHGLPSEVQRSFVIPVLDRSEDSSYNIATLLDDLADIPGEVICVFNNPTLGIELSGHSRIDKFCINNLNAGVSRSWNMGLSLAEGRSVFFLNADLHISRTAVEAMESFLFSLDRAAIVGPQGSLLDFASMRIERYFEKGTFDEPVMTDDVSGFCFAIHHERFLQHGLHFDTRYSPCFFEEWDIGMQVRKAGLACYAVPVRDFDHRWGISASPGRTIINYFGRPLLKADIFRANRQRFIAKWADSRR